MRYDLWITQYSSALQLLFLFPISRRLELEPTAGDIKSPICKLQMDLSEFQNVFVQIVKYICWIVAATFPSHYLWAWALCGGYQVAHLLTGRRVSHFPTHPRFPDFPGRISSNSRNGFTEYLQFISPLIGSPRPKPRPVSCLNWFDVKEVWMNQLYL